MDQLLNEANVSNLNDVSLVQQIFIYLSCLLIVVCFKVFDMDRDGVLNFNEIKDMIDILIFVAKESSNSSSFRNVTAENMLTELSQRVSKGCSTINGVAEVI